MFGPVQLYLAVKARADLGLMAAAAASAILFASTPFVIDGVATEYGIRLGRAGLMSSAQVGGFALAAFVAGRRFATSRRFFVGSGMAAALLNFLSTVAPTYPAFLVVRFGVGVAVGLLAWLAWARAMRSRSTMRSVAAIGPLTTAGAVPVVAWTAERGGADAVFLLLGALFLPALFLPAAFSGYHPGRSHKSPSRSNLVLIGALAALTMSGSALFVYAALIGERVVGLDPLAVSAAYTANAVAAFVAARRAGGASPPRVWLYAMVPAMAAVAFSGNGIAFGLGLAAWGFFFWMAVPKILGAIAAWSLAPEERVGDAQSAMAVGRAIGPAVAAALIGNGDFTAVGIFATVGVLLTAVTVHRVAAYRRTHSPPLTKEET